MNKIKVSKLQYKVQGEGRYIGVPSVFLQTFGCNFTCDGFGMPKGEKSNERNIVASLVTGYKQYRDLPLVSTGCDSYSSWDPRFKDFSSLITTDSLAETIVDYLPDRKWQDQHLVITGGEPFFQWQDCYPELLNHLCMRSLKELTFETNGTQPLTNTLKKYLEYWGIETRGWNSLTFSVSPKLSNSGENYELAVIPEVVRDYEKLGYTYLKFVVANENDVQEAINISNIYKDAGFKGPVYLMPLGSTELTYRQNATKIAELALKYGLRYSDRLQFNVGQI